MDLYQSARACICVSDTGTQRHSKNALDIYCIIHNFIRCSKIHFKPFFCCHQVFCCGVRAPKHKTGCRGVTTELRLSINSAQAGGCCTYRDVWHYKRWTSPTRCVYVFHVIVTVNSGFWWTHPVLPVKYSLHMDVHCSSILVCKLAQVVICRTVTQEPGVLSRASPYKIFCG